MIGLLPTTLSFNKNEYSIRSDYRVALLIFQALNDTELNDMEKVQVLIECLYESEIPQEDINEAVKQATWYLDCGQDSNDDNSKNKQPSKPLFDWEQDEQIIFSAINKVAGYEVRSVEYMHWWTFIGLFNEIGEGTFSTVVSIRNKKSKNKKLESWEKEFYNKNIDMVKLKKKYSEEEKAENDLVRKILTGGV